MGSRRVKVIMARSKPIGKRRDGAWKTKKEDAGGGANAIERQGLDLHRWTLDRVLPEAVAACDAGIEREKALERDVQRGETRAVILCQEVRGMSEEVNGIVREKKGWWRSMSPLPHGIRPVMGKSDAELRWCYAQALRAQRVAKTHREALNMAGPNAITFVLVGGGVELPG